ncbi:MAG: AAA family ATPase [Lachnospiraceae bacterium]|nr:AAA family ATPase [Lachnospiraceae bacterium]
MLCYDIRLRYAEEKTVFEKSADNKETELEEKLQKLNAGVYALTSEDDFYAAVYRTDDDFLDFAVAAWPGKISVSKIRKKLEWAVNSLYGVSGAKVQSLSEITAKKFIMMLEESDNREYLKRSTRRTGRDLELDYFDNSFFKINEEMSPAEKLTKKQALEKAKLIMADKSLYEEIDRIYASENSKKFYGYPVHYRIQTGNREAGMTIVNLLIQMLHSQGRILSSRINFISEIGENCYDESDLERICRHADGAAVVIEMKGSEENHGNYATSYEAVIRYLADLVEKYHTNTLFFFLEDIARPGFTRELMAKVTDCIDILDISEGTGNRDEAIEYFKHLIKQYSYTDLADDSIGDYLPKRRKTFKCHDIHSAFNRWSRDVLRNKAYSAYKKCKGIEKRESRKKGSAYDELQKMVGLTEVKKLADQIIASYKMQTVRENYGFKDCTISKHMVFTGNPGSAKTTVARLLADILTDEGVLKSGCLVECGRADLVGKYVGWTAKEVRDKFKEAEGGILFIDEAYSLVDDSKTYGDEAINTIVQEMENHRSSVIVIFAGYPDKMKEFLNRNEGLRSRIAFHLDFPDYKEDELISILDLMLKERGLRTDEKSMSKCRDIFARACKEEEYGNGRFVRNLIEQAMLKQAQRLIAGNKKGEISKASAAKLVETDFDVNIAEAFDNKRKLTIGFSV